MKRLTAFWLSACFLCTISVQAQSFIPERDSSDISLFEYATKIPKRNNVFNLDLEMHASFNTFFTGHKLDEAAFRFNHIKIEATGEVNDRLFYWYRQNLNQGNEGMDLENLPESIEYAMIGYRLNDKFTITLGKQDAAWGGFEYDLDPYAIYEYSDMNEYMDCYFTGITLGYQPTPSQELRLQVTDNRIGSMEDAYGLLPAGIEKPRAPLFYTFNWNSSYLDEILNLRYSATVGEQAKGKWMYMAVWFDPFYQGRERRGSNGPGRSPAGGTESKQSAWYVIFYKIKSDGSPDFGLAARGRGAYSRGPLRSCSAVFWP